MLIDKRRFLFLATEILYQASVVKHKNTNEMLSIYCSVTIVFDRFQPKTSLELVTFKCTLTGYYYSNNSIGIILLRCLSSTDE